MDNFINEWAIALAPSAKTRLNEPVIMYSLLFDDGSMYFGISRNPEKRARNHAIYSSNPFIREKVKGKTRGNEFELRIGKTIEFKEDLREEDEMIRMHRKLGFNVLNMRKGGCLGNLSKYK